MNSRYVSFIRALVAGSGIVAGFLALLLYGGKPYRVEAAAPPVLDETIYDGGLAAGWQDWSWAERNMTDREVLFQKKPTLRFDPSQYKGLFLHHGPLEASNYLALAFAIHGGPIGKQKLVLCAALENNQFGKKIPLAPYLPGGVIPARKFVNCLVPMKDLVAGKGKISGFSIQDGSGEEQGLVYLADIRFVSSGKRKDPTEIVLTVDASKRLGSISPYIYGMAQAGPELIEPLRLKLWRWGGNPATRYNWEKGNCWNAARDWQFRNGNYGKTAPEDRLPSGAADRAIATGKAGGADTLITIPTLGWVARDDNNGNGSRDVPNGSGLAVSPGSDAIAGYDPAENRRRVSQRSLPRKGRPFSDPPDLTDDVVYQDEWVYHLTRKFGKANAGGVRFYAMDNEPDLWDITHTDMQPVRPGYDMLRDQFLNYANAVKDVDGSAQITGPVSWGWTGYFYSPRDRGDNNFGTHADRKAHGDTPFLVWFLQEIAAADKKRGRRTLDILDVHYYPQADGVYGGRTDPNTNALRLRTTRALWDPNYSDESWVGTTVTLIPRLKQWVRQSYPGTKVGIMEWNWGADGTLNGGLAVAEVLGIFGREGLDMACYWAVPGVNSPGFFAYKMYRNADNAGNGFGDVAISAVSSGPDVVSCFGSLDTRTGKPVVMLINKLPQEDVTVTLNIAGAASVRTAEVYRYSGKDLKTIAHLPDIAMKSGRNRITLPAYSITLLRGK